ncbi:MAG: hypothetical protein WCV64_10405 [Desulfurivibrionaceae bacterium]|jgi:hypothetical protein
MQNTDICVILILEISVAIFVLWAAYKDHSIRKSEQAEGISPEITRGETSMGALYTVYGATIASFLVLIDKTLGIEGHKVILIIINFFCATYLFFFSTWFRNSVFFPLVQRVRKD